MPNEKILFVYMVKNGKRMRIEKSDMTKEFYNLNKEYLFCPNENCTAKIEYCHGEKLEYFRTKRSIVDGEEIIEQHIDGCEFGLDHDKNPGPKTIYNPNLGFLVSDEHMKAALNRANKKHKDPEYGKPKNTGSKKRNVKNVIRTKTDEVAIRGKAVLTQTDDSNTVEVEREPYLFQKYIDQVTESDYNTVKIIKGDLESLHFELNSITFKFRTVDGRMARVFFSESFKTRHPQHFDQLKHYKDYFDKVKQGGGDAFIACGGDVKYDNYGISIYLEAINHFTINEMYHYDILREINIF